MLRDLSHFGLSMDQPIRSAGKINDELFPAQVIGTGHAVILPSFPSRVSLFPDQQIYARS